MKRRSLFAALLALLIPTLASAQVPYATPTPNPMVYDDPAMHFQAPSGWQPVGQRQITVADLKSDPMTAAGWVQIDRSHRDTLIVQLQAYSGNLDSFEATYEQELRQQFDGTFIKGKESFTLSNGMPAYFIQVTTGEGFTTNKAYIVLWIDGVRGVAMVVSGPLDSIDESAAKAIFRRASATRYPSDRDY